MQLIYNNVSYEKVLHTYITYYIRSKSPIIATYRKYTLCTLNFKMQSNDVDHAVLSLNGQQDVVAITS